MNNLNHYVYKITFETGHIYYGVRSCECLPKEDPYLGSPYTYKHFWDEYQPVKTIIADDFLTREDANEFEGFCIQMQWLKNKELSLNASDRGVKFNNYGRKASPETIAKRVSKKSKTYTLINPEGNTVEITNLSQFCRYNKLTDTSMIAVSKGNRLHHHGWTNSLENHLRYKEKFELRGITVYKKYQQVQWREGGKNHLKHFKTLEEAIKFRDELEVKLGRPFMVKQLKKKLHKGSNKSYFGPLFV
jgi:hypothetical protein